MRRQKRVVGEEKGSEEGWEERKGITGGRERNKKKQKHKSEIFGRFAPKNVFFYPLSLP